MSLVVSQIVNLFAALVGAIGKKYLVMLGQPNAFSTVGIFDVNIIVVSRCPLTVFEDGDKT